AHMAASGVIHPEDLYRVCIAAAGELATFTTTSKRPPALPAYRHEQLRESFEPVMAALRDAPGKGLEQTATPIPLQSPGFGVHGAAGARRSLSSAAAFLPAARADVPAEELRRQFPLQIKVGPAERIRDLVNLALPGVPVRAMPVAPRQIPYHAGFAYFE